MGSAVNPFLRRLRSDALNWRRHSKESILKVTGHRTVYRNEKRPVRGVFIGILAEAVRFELTNGCPLPVFKTGAIDHSATLPSLGLRSGL